MIPTAPLAAALIRASVAKRWIPTDRFDWPEALDPTQWAMSPEWTSVFHTPLWGTLEPATQRLVARLELVNLFSLTLHGERPLVQGLCDEIYVRQGAEVSDYLHHFVDEENKHMQMFAMFCRRYGGKIYPWKKLALPRTLAPGEARVRFFVDVLIVEEIGLVYNTVLARDRRLPPIVRAINRVHQIDESRHLVMGRRLLAEAVAEAAPGWAPEVWPTLRRWVATSIDYAWRDFVNPEVYADAGLDDPHGIARRILAAPAWRAHRDRVSRRLVRIFRDLDLLDAA